MEPGVITLQLVGSEYVGQITLALEQDASVLELAAQCAGPELPSLLVHENPKFPVASHSHVLVVGLHVVQPLVLQHGVTSQPDSPVARQVPAANESTEKMARKKLAKNKMRNIELGQSEML